jgi:hypothetical protein
LDVAWQNQRLRRRYGPREQPAEHKGSCDHGAYRQEGSTQDFEAVRIPLDG